MQKGSPGVGSFCYCTSLSFAFTVTAAARIVYDLFYGSLHYVVDCCTIGVPLVTVMKGEVTGHGNRSPSKPLQLSAMCVRLQGLAGMVPVGQRD